MRPFPQKAMNQMPIRGKWRRHDAGGNCLPICGILCCFKINEVPIVHATLIAGKCDPNPSKRIFDFAYIKCLKFLNGRIFIPNTHGIIMILTSFAGNRSCRKAWIRVLFMQPIPIAVAVKHRNNFPAFFTADFKHKITTRWEQTHFCGQAVLNLPNAGYFKGMGITACENSLDYRIVAILLLKCCYKVWLNLSRNQSAASLFG